MKIPNDYMIDVMKGGEGHSLKDLADWVNKNKPREIEMTEHQFWQFTLLQPLPVGEERYWTTFHGIPIRCPEMTVQQQMNLRIWNYYKYLEEDENSDQD